MFPAEYPNFKIDNHCSSDINDRHNTNDNDSVNDGNDITQNDDENSENEDTDDIIDDNHADCHDVNCLMA
eukprot:scaffold433598_cov20-Prasinocladus_malaysianus.AAC.1